MRDQQLAICCKSRNEKLGEGVWVTQVPVRETCPKSCPLRDHGCYGQRGIGGHNDRLQNNAERQGATPLDIAREEARLVRLAALRRKPGTPLRLHFAGDSSSTTAATLVSAACHLWPGPVWTYTHAWRQVPRSAWGAVSVLASIEGLAEAHRAFERGYAPALVVPEHSSGRAWKSHGWRWIPCPYETRGVSCADCRLCFDADKLRERKSGIVFAAHGSGAHRVRDVLVQLKVRRKS